MIEPGFLDYGVMWLGGSLLAAAWFGWLCDHAPERPDLDPDYPFFSEADERDEWEAAEADRRYDMERER